MIKIRCYSPFKARLVWHHVHKDFGIPTNFSEKERKLGGRRAKAMNRMIALIIMSLVVSLTVNQQASNIPEDTEGRVVYFEGLNETDEGDHVGLGRNVPTAPAPDSVEEMAEVQCPDPLSETDIPTTNMDIDEPIVDIGEPPLPEEPIVDIGEPPLPPQEEISEPIIEEIAFIADPPLPPEVWDDGSDIGDPIPLPPSDEFIDRDIIVLDPLYANDGSDKKVIVMPVDPYYVDDGSDKKVIVMPVDPYYMDDESKSIIPDDRKDPSMPIVPLY